MRERFRTGTADALLCLIVVALQAELWLTDTSRSSRTTVELIAFTAVCAVALVAMLVARIGARRARTAQEETDRAQAAEREAAAVAFAELVRAKQAAVTAAVNDVLVEIVASQQAIVRQAHPDDILVRLHAAEDNAHASLADLQRVSEELSVGDGGIQTGTGAAASGSPSRAKTPAIPFDHAKAG